MPDAGFALDYEKNLQLKIDAAKAVELGRGNTTVEILREGAEKKV